MNLPLRPPVKGEEEGIRRLGLSVLIFPPPPTPRVHFCSFLHNFGNRKEFSGSPFGAEPAAYLEVTVGCLGG